MDCGSFGTTSKSNTSPLDTPKGEEGLLQMFVIRAWNHMKLCEQIYISSPNPMIKKPCYHDFGLETCPKDYTWCKLEMGLKVPFPTRCEHSKVPNLQNMKPHILPQDLSIYPSSATKTAADEFLDLDHPGIVRFQWSIHTSGLGASSNLAHTAHAA